MRIKLIILLSCILSLFIIYRGDRESAARSRVGLAPHMEALQIYLDLDHEDVLEKSDEKRESPQALQKVLEFKKDLEPEFIRLLDKGLDDQVLQKKARFLEEQWTRREAFLKKKPNLGLTEDDYIILRNMTKEAYVNEGREQLIQRYQEKAVGALHAIGTPTAILALKNFRAKTENGVLKKIIDRKLPAR
jgi:hypothetical protein